MKKLLITITLLGVGFSLAKDEQDIRLIINNETEIGTTVIAGFDKYSPQKECSEQKKTCVITQFTPAWKTKKFMAPSKKTIYITMIPSKSTKKPTLYAKFSTADLAKKGGQTFNVHVTSSTITVLDTKNEEILTKKLQ